MIEGMPQDKEEWISYLGDSTSYRLTNALITSYSKGFVDALPDSEITTLDLGHIQSDILTPVKLIADLFKKIFKSLPKTKIEVIYLGNDDLDYSDTALLQKLHRNIRMSQVKVIILEGEKKFPNRPPAYFRGLCTPSLEALMIHSCKLYSLNEDQIIFFAQELLNCPKLSSIDFGGNKLSRWKENQIQAFGLLLRGTPVTSLGLQSNQFANVTPELMRYWMTALQGTHVTRLDIGDNELSHWSLPLIDAFQDGLQQTGIVELIFSTDDIPQEEALQQQMSMLCQTPTIQTLTIARSASCFDDDAYCLGINELESLGNILTHAPNIQKLNLDKCYLGHTWDEIEIKALIEHLKDTKVFSLNLSNNHLYCWNEKLFQTFLNELSQSPISYVDCSQNDLSEERIAQLEIILQRNKSRNSVNEEFHINRSAFFQNSNKLSATNTPDFNKTNRSDLSIT